MIRSIAASLLVLFSLASAAAQTTDVIYCRQPVFRIPFQVEPGEQGRLREVQLFLSEDQLAWRYYATVSPDQRYFQFQSQRDGLYWFTVRTVDLDGKAAPAQLEGSKPGLKVLVDTQLPEAVLRAAPPRGEQVGVDWEVRDANIDLTTLLLEWRSSAYGDWQPLAVEPMALGQKYWLPPGRGAVEVRLRVRDRADNQASAGPLTLGVTGAPASQADAVRPGVPSVDQNAVRPQPRQQVPAGPNVKICNTARINVNYSLEDVGPSGVSMVELWYTLDGRSWQRYGEDADKQSPFLFEVNGEGTYGLSMVVKSGVGMGDRPPSVGDAPQMWIEVDTTKPALVLHGADAGRGSEAGNLTITWQATDKNLASQPISLFHSEQLAGPWNPIATSLENSGRYVWRLPPGAPYKFFVRLEAIDRGGNIAHAETAKHVIVDLSQPKARLLGADGAAKNP